MLRLLSLRNAARLAWTRSPCP